MDPNLIDPHNHAPEVAPDDVWGDAEGFQDSSTALPPKRPKPEGATPAPSARNNEGIRIETITPRRQTEDSPHKLEVKEFDGTVIRLDPVEDNGPAKVPRHVTFHEKPAESDGNDLKSGEASEWGQSRKQSIRWIIGTGVGVATLVIVALMLLPLVNKSNAARTTPQEGLDAQTEQHSEDATPLSDLLTRQKEAELIFRTYASARIVDDFLPLIRDAKTLEPIIRAQQRPALANKAWDPTKSTKWNVSSNEGGPYGLLQGTLPDYSKFSAYLVLREGHLYLDWKATTAYGTATFDELSKNQGNPSEIRASISIADFYTIGYPEAEYHSYRLTAADDVQTIWCYTRRGDATDQVVEGLFQPGQILRSVSELQKVTLRLNRGPAGTLPNQWMIAELLHKDWINP